MSNLIIIVSPTREISRESRYAANGETLKVFQLLERAEGAEVVFQIGKVVLEIEIAIKDGFAEHGTCEQTFV